MKGIKQMADTAIERLLTMVRCPVCHAPRSLELKPGRHPRMRHIELRNEHLFCNPCSSQFAVTHDQIPILLTPHAENALVPFFGNDDDLSPLAANVSVYDSISDDYDQFTRKNDVIGMRLRAAARWILGNGPAGEPQLRHLDFGCGPGHVLKWFEQFQFEQVGLDVSLRNLRNARSKTGCLVVCGDACNMPFSDGAFDIITESSVLHHIELWKIAVSEAARVCNKGGGIVLDAEPSKTQMNWSRFAIFVFNLRFPVYKLLSYIRRDKYVFRNTAQAKLNLRAEIHHQPGTGFPVEDLPSLFGQDFETRVIHSPTADLSSGVRPNWKTIIICVLSARNPWNPLYGAFTAIARRRLAA